MGPYTITAILALGLGCTYPSWASVVRVQCVPGAYFPDSDDCTRYYQCVGESSIKALSCPDGTHYCGEGEQHCCSELIDSEADCELLSTDSDDKATQTNDKTEYVAESESSDASGQHEYSTDLKSDEDDRSLFDFVGQHVKFMTRKEGQDINPVDEHGSIEEEPVSVEVPEEEKGTTANGVREGVNVVFESNNDGPSANNDYSIHAPTNKESISEHGAIPSSENGDEVDIKEGHGTLSDGITVVNVVEDNISKETPENPKLNESKEASNDAVYRKKRNDDETKQEAASATEKIDEDNLKKKKDKNNQDSNIEVSTLVSSKERDTGEGQKQPIVNTTGKYIGEETNSNEENERLNPEPDEDNSKYEILETPSSDKPISVNPSIVQTDAGRSLAHSHSQEYYKAHHIVEIVKRLLRLTGNDAQLLQTTPAP